MYCLAFSFLSLSLSLSLKKKGLERILGAFRGGVRHISGESCSRRTPPANVNTVSGLLLDLFRACPDPDYSWLGLPWDLFGTC